MKNLFHFCLSTLFIFSFQAVEARAHGTMEMPVSRVYNCFLENPESPKSDACKEAVSVGGKQALYDWNGVNIGDAADRHMELIPDGKLCSAGNELFKGLDLARSDWHSTNLAPDQNGNLDFTFIATAPHSTKYFRFYVTDDGYNPLNPLKWSDLEPAPFCEINSVTLENGRYKMSCPFPQNKNGSHLIYAIWQRDDSPEAFYTCMDVEFTGGEPVVWRSIGELRAHQDLSTGDKVTFRLFGPGGTDAEEHEITLANGQTTASEWPFHLASAVNSRSSIVNIGVLDGDGNINPVMSSQDNNVYVASETEYTFQIDIEMDDNGGDPGDTCDCCGECVDTCTDPPPDIEVDFVYPDGIGSYQPGTVVLGTDGKVYECKPFPFSGWCNQSELYYAPGTGLAWQDAWVLVE